MRSGFGCDACGSPAVRLPLDLHEDAPIHCDGCGCTLMAWGAFKRRVEAEMSREAGEQGTAAAAHPGEGRD